MQPDRWTLVQAIFDEASALPGRERTAFLQRACAGDTELQSDVAGLLETLEADAGRLDEIVRGVVHSAFQSFQGLSEGALVGSYRLLKKIGEGGMASVYLASPAAEEFERRVAIKLLRPEISAAEMARRFRRERQILANLDHPNIARMLDGGVSEGGIPYLVMEYVEGVPIDEHCRAHKLGPRRIAELMDVVCSAVESAHASMVVHRDIKPSNILVTRDGVPKLLDFGIAKLLSDAARAPETALTRPDQRIMTLEYASPEQILGEPITTATDVYSLGIVLFELLTGLRPYRAAAGNPVLLQHKICREDLPRPSAAVQEKALARPLTGDLDDIVLKAARKDAKTRYRSVAHLAQDLRAYLAGYPVSASKGAARYRAARFVRRHRLGMSVAALFVLMLVGFSTAMVVLALRLQRERDTAREEHARAAQVSGFLTNLFSGADPFRAKGSELTARELLDEGWTRIAGQLNRQPAVRAEILDTMAVAYQHLGALERARQLFAAEAGAQRQRGPAGNIPLSKALRQLADVELDAGEPAAAETHLRQALKLQQAALPPGDRELAHTLNNLGLVLQTRGNMSQAADLFRRAVAISERYPDQRSQTLVMMSNLGSALADAGRLEEAVAVLRDVLARRQALLGPSHPQVAHSMMRLARVLHMRGSYQEAEALFDRGLEGYRRTLPPDNIEILAGMHNLARLLQDMHRYQEAEPLYRDAIEKGRRTLGETVGVAAWQSSLASLLEEEGHSAQAERLYLASLAVYRRKLGPNSAREADTLCGLGRLYIKDRDNARAQSSLDRALAIDRALLGPAHPATLQAQYALALLRRAQKRPAEALALLREVVEADRQNAPRSLPAAEHLLGLSAILWEAGDRREAESAARQSLEIRRALLPAASWQVREAEDRLHAILEQ